MDVQFLKEKLLEENRVADLLLSLGCHHVKQSSNMIQCCNVDGNNPTAVCVYLNENLTCINYTRQMLKSGQTRTTDIIDLVSFVRSCTFFQSLQWICNINGWDYYEEQEETAYSLQVLHMLTKMNNASVSEEDDNRPLKPLNLKILSYYLPYQNKMWEDDGISLRTQKEFSVMYDPQSNRIVLPLFDPLGTLIGLKGRLMKKELSPGEQKYLYMQNNFNKSRFLFGLDKTIDMIARQGYCPIFEGEKSVMIAYEHGVGSVAVCGSKISRCQANMLTRLNVPLIICFDKDRTEDEVKKEAEVFMEQIPVSYMIDKCGLLENKQSPADDWDKFKVLIKNNIYKIR